jgi:hypothetical protein
MGPRARLYADDGLSVLWLSRGEQELALSADGIWLRARSRELELTWTEIEQVQMSPMRLFGPALAWVDLFTADTAERVGLFPEPLAGSWVAAAAAAAGTAGCSPLPLQGATGFAILSPDGA